MRKSIQLKHFNRCLLALGILQLISSVQMEICGGQTIWGNPFSSYMTVHVILSCLMMLCVYYHLYLHFGWKGWSCKIKKKQTKRLMIISCLMLVSGIAAFLHLAQAMRHSSLGGVHGKIGFLFLLLSFGHITKHIKWYGHGHVRTHKAENIIGERRAEGGE